MIRRARRQANDGRADILRSPTIVRGKWHHLDTAVGGAQAILERRGCGDSARVHRALQSSAARGDANSNTRGNHRFRNDRANCRLDSRTPRDNQRTNRWGGVTGAFGGEFRTTRRLAAALGANRRADRERGVRALGETGRTGCDGNARRALGLNRRASRGDLRIDRHTANISCRAGRLYLRALGLVDRTHRQGRQARGGCVRRLGGTAGCSERARGGDHRALRRLWQASGGRVGSHGRSAGGGRRAIGGGHRALGVPLRAGGCLLHASGHRDRTCGPHRRAFGDGRRA